MSNSYFDQKLIDSMNEQIKRIKKKQEQFLKESIKNGLSWPQWILFLLYKRLKIYFDKKIIIEYPNGLKYTSMAVIVKNKKYNFNKW